MLWSPGFTPVLSCAWASRPTASQYTGLIIKITDVGVPAGALFISDGTEWKPVFPIVLGRSAASGLTNTNSTNSAEFNFAVVTIPAGLIGINGALEVAILGTNTGSTNSKSYTARLATTSGALSGGLQICSGTTTTAAQVSCALRGIARNRGAANSQVAAATNLSTNVGFSSGAVQTAALDSTSALYVNINGVKALGTETLTIEWYEVRLIP